MKPSKLKSWKYGLYILRWITKLDKSQSIFQVDQQKNFKKSQSITGQKTSDNSIILNVKYESLIN